MKTIITFLCLFIIGTVSAQRKPIAALVVLDSIPLVEPQLRELALNVLDPEKIKSIKERTMLQNTKEMLLKAKKEKYSVGAFNFTNLETLQGILEAAEEEKSPVILQTSSSAIKYMGLRIYNKND